MRAHNSFGIHKIRLELQHLLMIVAGGQSVPQSGEPGVLDQRQVSSPQSFGGSSGIERLNVVGVRLETFFRKVKGLVRELFDPLLDRVGQKYLFARNEMLVRVQTSVQGVVVIKLLVQDCLQQVVHGLGIVRIGVRNFLETLDGLVIFQAVEMIESAPGKSILNLRLALRFAADGAGNDRQKKKQESSTNGETGLIGFHARMYAVYPISCLDASRRPKRECHSGLSSRRCTVKVTLPSSEPGSVFSDCPARQKYSRLSAVAG